MEIEQDYNINANDIKNNYNSNINNCYFNENMLLNNMNKFNFTFSNRAKYGKKRNYNDLLRSSEKIIIKETELKYLLNVINKIKLKLDSNNNYIEKTFEPEEEKEEQENKNDKKEEIPKIDFKIDYSSIDLRDIIFQLYQSNNLSMELKKFVLRKLVDNAIKVERTFNNYFNINNMPNKK